MTELEKFAKITLEQGGEWFKLEESEFYSLHESKTKYMPKNYSYYSPVFQIFDSKGKRVLAHTDYRTTYEKYRKLCKVGDNNG